MPAKIEKVKLDKTQLTRSITGTLKIKKINAHAGKNITRKIINPNSKEFVNFFVLKEFPVNLNNKEIIIDKINENAITRIKNQTGKPRDGIMILLHKLKYTLFS